MGSANTPGCMTGTPRHSTPAGYRCGHWIRSDPDRAMGRAARGPSTRTEARTRAIRALNPVKPAPQLHTSTIRAPTPRTSHANFTCECSPRPARWRVPFPAAVARVEQVVANVLHEADICAIGDPAPRNRAPQLRICARVTEEAGTLTSSGTTVPTMWIMNYLQAQHLDTDYYDKLFNPGAYLSTHRDHQELWHRDPR